MKKVWGTCRVSWGLFGDYKIDTIGLIVDNEFGYIAEFNDLLTEDSFLINADHIWWIKIIQSF